MALFGGGPPPRRGAPVAVPRAAGSGRGGGARGRGAGLGAPRPAADKRHGLVASLRRLDGRSFREINAWLNRDTGVTRVDDASIAQLERSIDLLLAELDRRSGAGRG